MLSPDPAHPHGIHKYSHAYTYINHYYPYTLHPLPSSTNTSTRATTAELLHMACCPHTPQAPGSMPGPLRGHPLPGSSAC
jgi:hypothetical protein